MTTKADIRMQIREQRRTLTPEWVRQTSDRIQARVLALKEWPSARQVCCYLALPVEVQTDRLLEACWQTRKQVWVPAFHKAHGRYECVALHHGDALGVGGRSVREPLNPDWTAPDAMDLVVTPGLAFDPAGNRLGHGGGHYDELLACEALHGAFKVGLAFTFQVRDHMPVSAHDVRMDIVVTENAVIRCRSLHNVPKGMN